MGQSCGSPPAPCAQIWGGERCPPPRSRGPAAATAVGHVTPSHVPPFSSFWQFPLTTRALRRNVPVSELSRGCTAAMGQGGVQ